MPHDDGRMTETCYGSNIWGGEEELLRWRTINCLMNRSYFTTDSQSVSMSWYRAPLWDLRPNITSCRNVTVGNLRSCFEVWSYFTTDGQSVNMSWCRAHSGPCDQMLLPVGILLSEICGLVSAGRSLWREDGSAICSVITQWSESLRTRNHTLLSHLRLPQLRGSVSLIYIRQEQGGSVIPLGTGFPLRRLLLAGLRWKRLRRVDMQHTWGHVKWMKTLLCPRREWEDFIEVDLKGRMWECGLN
jgi:hypothetical protein